MANLPQQLKENDKVAIVAPARHITLPEVLPSIQLLSSWGLNVVVGQSIGCKDHQFAGSDEQRASDFQKMIDNPEIKAVFCARGGYGCSRLLDLLNFDKLVSCPKWIVGYSDITAFLSHLYFKYGIASAHGTMSVNIDDRKSCPAYDSLKNVLFGKPNTIEAPYNKHNVCGHVEGELIGGNLSVLYSLLGSESLGQTKDKILLIEDIDEYLYHIDRMMLSLQRAGKTNQIKALIVGKFVNMHDNETAFGGDSYDIIAKRMANYNIPLAFDIPVGHTGKENHAFVHGGKTIVDIDEHGTCIRQE